MPYSYPPSPALTPARGEGRQAVCCANWVGCSKYPEFFSESVRFVAEPDYLEAELHEVAAGSSSHRVPDRILAGFGGLYHQVLLPAVFPDIQNQQYNAQVGVGGENDSHLVAVYEGIAINAVLSESAFFLEHEIDHGVICWELFPWK